MESKVDAGKVGSWFSWSWLATIVLIIFKALGKISLTWVQVFLPAIIGNTIALLLVFVLLIVVAIENR